MIDNGGFVANDVGSLLVALLPSLSVLIGMRLFAPNNLSSPGSEVIERPLSVTIGKFGTAGAGAAGAPADELDSASVDVDASVDDGDDVLIWSQATADNL